MIIKRQKEFGNKENKLKRRDWEIKRGKRLSNIDNIVSEGFGDSQIDVSKLSEEDLIRRSRKGNFFESSNVKNQRGVKKVKGFKDPNIKPLSDSEDAFDRALKKLAARAKVIARKDKEETKRWAEEEAIRLKKEAEEVAAKKIKEQELQALKKAKNIRNAKIAGGVALGATAIGTGVYAYNKHKNKKNDNKKEV